MKRGSVLTDIRKCFKTVISTDKMLAEIYCTEHYHNMKTLTKLDIIQYLEENRIIYGIDHRQVHLLTTQLAADQFPLTIAKGMLSVDGEDGKITYMFNASSEVEKNDDWDFRDVMRIPTIKKGEKLAKITAPTKGKPGKNIFGMAVPARPGKPHQMKAGKNVRFNDKDQIFYAETDGQVSIRPNALEVHDVFYVDESLSMKSGNLDFVGSIIIKGDVPTGFTVKAGGDIKVFGLVESATLHAGGSLYIYEGLSGMQNGTISADDNIHIGYINQGIAHAGRSIYVENAILHSECTARQQIYCQKGNIIGGTMSAGQLIEAKDIGNRLNTQTMIHFSLDQSVDDFKKMKDKKETLQAARDKLLSLGEKLKRHDYEQNPKLKIAHLRQRHSLKEVNQQIDKITTALAQLNTSLERGEQAKLLVSDCLYANVTIAFGKYKRKINHKRQHVRATLEQNEIVLHSL